MSEVTSKKHIDSTEFEDLVFEIRGIGTLAHALVFQIDQSGISTDGIEEEAMYMLKNRLNTIADK